MFDAHHLGRKATGNETWSRAVACALEADGEEPWTFLTTAAGVDLLPTTVSPDRIILVSGSSARRLLVDAPRLVRHHRPAALVAQYTLPLADVPGVVAVHDLSFEAPEAQAWLSRSTIARYRATIRWSVRRARAVVVPSQWTKADLLAHYAVDPDRVFVAPCGVDPGWAQAARERTREQPEQLVVLAVGTVLPRKNLVVVARAVARLRRAGTPAVLRLVGPVPAAGRQELARLRAVLPDDLELWGLVSQAQLVEAYRTSSVLAYPSWFEGFGIPVVEAMVAELPVVVSSATCLPEVAGDAALVVPPDDDAAWAAALLRAAGPEATSLVAAGAVRAPAYDWTTTASVLRQAVAHALS